MEPVKIDVVSNWLLIWNLDPHVCNEIKEQLTYNFVRIEYTTWNKPQQRQVIRRKCYVEDLDQKKNKVLICRVGFLDRIQKILTERRIPFIVNDHLLQDANKQKNLAIDVNALSSISFRPFQKECIDIILSSRGGVIVCPTGMGKTFILAALCKVLPNAKILIMAKSLSTIDEIKKNCQQFDIVPGIVDGNVKTPPNKRVLITTVKSFYKCDPNKFDIVLVDECHELMTEMGLKSLRTIKNAKLFGFTATPVRADGAHFHLEEIFGPIIYHIRYQQAVDANLIKPIAVVWYECPHGPSVSTLSLVLQKKIGIWQNKARNELIAKIAKDYYHKGMQTLILVDTVNHAIELAQYLPEFVVCAASCDINLLSRYERKGYKRLDQIKDTISRREEFTEKFRKRQVLGVIATNIWSTGVSFNDLEVLIRADAKTSKVANLQAPGRVCRIPLTVKKEYGIIVDFIDRFSPEFLRRSKERFRIYRKMGWLQCDSNWNLLTRI